MINDNFYYVNRCVIYNLIILEMIHEYLTFDKTSPNFHEELLFYKKNPKYYCLCGYMHTMVTFFNLKLIFLN